MVDSGTVSSSQRSGVVNVNPNAESVEEVRVLVNNFNAEYGRNSSVLVNVITKSGSNGCAPLGLRRPEQLAADEELLPGAAGQAQHP